LRKHFPKRFKSKTTFDNNGFVYYICSNSPQNFVIKDGIRLDNNIYIVPYSKELLIRYNAHINIEICCQSTLIKYLFKYVSRGSDKCRMVIAKENHDEIQAYFNCRFMSFLGCFAPLTVPNSSS
jgi:hypothetical protein